MQARSGRGSAAPAAEVIDGGIDTYVGPVVAVAGRGCGLRHECRTHSVLSMRAPPAPGAYAAPW